MGVGRYIGRGMSSCQERVTRGSGPLQNDDRGPDAFSHPVHSILLSSSSSTDAIYTRTPAHVRRTLLEFLLRILSTYLAFRAYR